MTAKQGLLGNTMLRWLIVFVLLDKDVCALRPTCRFPSRASLRTSRVRGGVTTMAMRSDTDRNDISRRELVVLATATALRYAHARSRARSRDTLAHTLARMHARMLASTAHEHTHAHTTVPGYALR